MERTEVIKYQVERTIGIVPPQPQTNINILQIKAEPDTDTRITEAEKEYEALLGDKAGMRKLLKDVNGSREIHFELFNASKDTLIVLA